MCVNSASEWVRKKFLSKKTIFLEKNSLRGFHIFDPQHRSKKLTGKE
jgi:hypothetical protein